MGTRAVITFTDDFGKHSVYQHWDGDPETVVSNITTTLAGRKCWNWPRWEADEFAAAYIAQNKTGGGNLRLTSGPSKHGDLSFTYTVDVFNGKLRVKTRSGRKLLGTDYIIPNTDKLSA